MSRDLEQRTGLGRPGDLFHLLPPPGPRPPVSPAPETFEDFDIRCGTRNSPCSPQPIESARPQREPVQRAWLPPIEVSQTDSELVRRVEIAGVPRERIHLEATREGITIRGERESHHESRPEDGYCMSEFTYGVFERQLEWPVAVKHEEAKAAYEEGILTVRIPLAEEARGREPKEIPTDWTRR